MTDRRTNMTDFDGHFLWPPFSKQKQPQKIINNSTYGSLGLLMPLQNVLPRSIGRLLWLRSIGVLRCRGQGGRLLIIFSTAAVRSFWRFYFCAAQQRRCAYLVDGDEITTGMTCNNQLEYSWWLWLWVDSRLLSECHTRMFLCKRSWCVCIWIQSNPHYWFPLIILTTG